MRALALSLLTLGLAAPAVADDAALLLGIERYEELRRISGADDMARAEEALDRAGYRVLSDVNTSRGDALDLLETFQSEARDARRLVAALSGHFVTDGRRTWLLTADAEDPSLFTAPSTAVSLDSVMAVLARTSGQAVLILGRDAGRDDDLDGYLREGIGDLDVPQGVTVIYADPNDVDNVLRDAVTVPGANITAYIRSARGWSLDGYAPRSLVMQAPLANPQPVPEPQPTPQADASLAAWATAQTANTADAYRNFIFTYPDSRFAPEARRRLDAIESDPTRNAELVEDALDLTRAQRRAVQENLTLLGYNTRGVDGIFGNGSRTAIGNWQGDNGMAETGFLTARQISDIAAQAEARRSEIEAQERAAEEQAEAEDRAYWAATGASGREADLRAYLQRYPDGLYAQEARTTLEAVAAPPANSQAQAIENAMNINPIMARLVETRLAQMGYETGTIDGQFDASTRRAIRQYQADRGLPATGYMTQTTMVRLLADAVTD